MTQNVLSTVVAGFVIGTIVGVMTGHFVLALAWGAVFAIFAGVVALLVLGLKRLTHR